MQRVHVRRYEHRITVAASFLPARLLQRVYHTAPKDLRQQVQHLRRDPEGRRKRQRCGDHKTLGRCKTDAEEFRSRQRPL